MGDRKPEYFYPNTEEKLLMAEEMLSAVKDTRAFVLHMQDLLDRHTGTHSSSSGAFDQGFMIKTNIGEIISLLEPIRRSVIVQRHDMWERLESQREKS